MKESGFIKHQMDIMQRKAMIARVLRELRISSGYTQKQVAEYLGIKPNTYSGYEAAKSEPCAEMIVRLADLYKCPTDLILARGSENHKDQILEYNSAIDKMKTDLLTGRTNTELMQLIETVAFMADKLSDLTSEKDKNV